VLAGVLAVDPLLGQPFTVGGLQAVGLAAGLALVAAGFALPEGRLRRIGAGACASLLALAFLLGSAELFFRAIGHDFSPWKVRKEQIPPFYLLPDEPFGDGLFKRRGPLTWTGQVLATRVRQLGIAPNPYEAEPTITVTYDADGFRNPPGLTDWDVVVAGDSFTELGFLPDEQLSTSVLARALGRRVKNLGVCATSTLCQLAYLERFGLSPSTKDAIIVFYEGNDVRELDVEFEAVEAWRRTGENPRAQRGNQHSLVVALVRALQRSRTPEGTQVEIADAVFAGRDGDVPLTVAHASQDPAAMPAVQKERLATVLDRYAAIAAEHGLRPWLVCVPCKLRVHRERLRFLPRAKPGLRGWTPDELPRFLADLCAARRIRFVDAAPALRAAADASGELLFNSIYDTHLDARGAAIVGEEMARALARTGELEGADALQTMNSHPR
jgi:hypothetical protein